MKILALDFDGVIVKSNLEILFTSLNTYLRFNPSSKILHGEKLTFNNCQRVFRKEKRLVDKFNKYRSFMRNAYDLYPLWHAIENKIGLKDQDDLDKIKDKMPEKILSRFFRAFYKNRHYYQKKDLKSWLKLNLPYKKIIDDIKKVDNAKILILSTRDGISIVDTLKEFDIDIKKEDIIGNDFGVNKKENMVRIIKEYKTKPEDIVFVDDLLVQLLPIKKLGVNCFLATWRRRSIADIRKARKEDIKTLTQDNFYKKISEALA